MVSAFSSLMGEVGKTVSCLPSLVEVEHKLDMSELVSLFEPGKMMRKFEGDTLPSLKIYQVSHTYGLRLTDSYLSQALVHLFKVATIEVKKFNSKDWLSKVAYEEDGILMSKNRLNEGLSFVTAGELTNLNLGDLAINVASPLIDRYSELAYSICNQMLFIVEIIKELRQSTA